MDYEETEISIWKEATNDSQMESNIVYKETGLGEVLIFQNKIVCKEEYRMKHQQGNLSWIGEHLFLRLEKRKQGWVRMLGVESVGKLKKHQNIRIIRHEVSVQILGWKQGTAEQNRVLCYTGCE